MDMEIMDTDISLNGLNDAMSINKDTEVTENMTNTHHTCARDDAQMPPLASEIVDLEAISTITTWIDTL